PNPPRPEPQPTQLISPNPVIVEFRNQLDQLQSERHRRRQLSAASASDEAWLRQQIVSPTDELTNAPQRSTELRDSHHDPDVGI
ncbi:hypothetical protein, partial [Nocardia brasiliensis]|uniref:hypothetical protein n=1 Tax=Nocardia brasiliensis TaxID=37326 RepID=UPI002458176D